MHRADYGVYHLDHAGRVGSVRHGRYVDACGVGFE